MMNALDARTIDVWFADLDVVAERRGPALGASLSHDERRRASRLPGAVARHFSAGREMLRFIVGRANDLAPADIVFSLGAFGKPFVSCGHPFNAARSGRSFVVAVSTDGAIGIDIERVRDTVDHLRVAKRLLPADAVRRLTALSQPDQRRAFFEAWVRAEARAKALGAGLLPVWSSSTQPETTPDHAEGFKTAADLALKIFEPERDVVGCLAVPGDRGTALRLRSVEELGPAA
jgi:4'-phosphopantetheinyl transferase